MKLDMPLEHVEYQLFWSPSTMQEGVLLFEKSVIKGVMFFDPHAHEGLGEADIEALLVFLGVKNKSTELYKATDEDMQTFVELIIQD